MLFTGSSDSDSFEMFDKTQVVRNFNSKERTALDEGYLRF